MKIVEYLPKGTNIAAAKAEAALKDLQQAWAYYTPEPLPETKADAPTLGYVPYYDAA